MMNKNKPNFFDRLPLYFSMIRYGNAHNRDFAHEHYSFFVKMIDDLKQLGYDLKGLRVLDVGCGKSFWLTLLLHSYGAHVTGIDTEVVEPGFNIKKYIKILKRNGIERVLRTLYWDIFYASPYYRELEKLVDFPLKFKTVDTRNISITDIDFPDSTFDLVVSYEVFEHIPDVVSAIERLYKLMKHDGITYLCIHNYASISGGHHIAWKYPDTEPSMVVPPWDHLRQNIYPSIPSWINRMREVDYHKTFIEKFQIIEWLHPLQEGKNLLTKEIEEELSNYSKEELLNKWFIIVAKPKV